VATDLYKPSSARIIDYFLGGDHNYAVDRRLARQFEEVFPGIAHGWRLQRRFLSRVTAYLIWKEGIHCFLDFGSGLPTCGNLHEVALFHTPRARILYSDNDPEIVEYGEQFVIGSGLDNVRYLACDAAKPETLLDDPAVGELFGQERRIAVGFTSLAHLLEQDVLARSLRVIYDWVAPGSHLIFSFANDQTNDFPELVMLLRSLRSFYPRPSAEILELLGPWQVTRHGVRCCACWPKSYAPEGVLRTNSVLLAYKP
jgi:hypothetical protein